MSDLVGLFNLLAPFFGLILLGFVSGRRAGLPEAGLAWMQFFLVYLALPALLFRLTSAKPIDEFANGRFAAMTTLATASAYALSFAASMWRQPRLSQGVMGALAGSYSNIGYMGPPLVLSFLGPEATAPVALILVFDTLFLFSATPALMAFAGMRRQSPTALVAGIAIRIATHPFMAATMLGLLASSLRLETPAALTQMLVWLSNAAAPCALFLLGLALALRPIGRMTRDVPMLVAVKLVIHPLLVWLLLSALGGFSPVWVQAAVVMAALPPALNIFVLASQYQVGIERASAAILAGTLLSMATLTAIIWLLKTGTMPVSPFGR